MQIGIAVRILAIIEIFTPACITDNTRITTAGSNDPANLKFVSKNFYKIRHFCCAMKVPADTEINKRCHDKRYRPTSYHISDISVNTGSRQFRDKKCAR